MEASRTSLLGRKELARPSLSLSPFLSCLILFVCLFVFLFFIPDDFVDERGLSVLCFIRMDEYSFSQQPTVTMLLLLLKRHLLTLIQR